MICVTDFGLLVNKLLYELTSLIHFGFDYCSDTLKVKQSCARHVK